LVAQEENWVYGIMDVEKPRLDPLLVVLRQLR
jgi:hypothetical protein